MNDVISAAIYALHRYLQDCPCGQSVECLDCTAVMESLSALERRPDWMAKSKEIGTFFFADALLTSK